MAEEWNTRPTCHSPVPPTRPIQKRVTHVSKIGCTTPIQMPSKESGDPYIVSCRPEQPEAARALVSTRLIQIEY